MTIKQKISDRELLERIENDADMPVSPAVDGEPLRALADAVRDRKDAEESVRVGVESARAAGLSWGVIGAVLGVSRQAALKKYGN